MFTLVEIVEGKPVPFLDHEDKPHVYTDGKEAARMADYWASVYESYGVLPDGSWGYTKVRKFQPRPLKVDWQARERTRFADGTYQPLPWVNEPWFHTEETSEHFAHVSTEDGASIAYTQDAAKGSADRQTRTRPGRYLQQFYGHVLDKPTIARLAAEFSKTYEENALQFATTADEWERVYTNGPNSCMAHKIGSYSSHIHPVRVYAYEDLQLAYLERDGRVTARAIVWPAKMIYTRIYGDGTRLEDLLMMAGYSSGSIEGAKIARVEGVGRGRRDVVVMPYVDYIQGATDKGDYILLDGHGPLSCENTSGLSESGCQCNHCDTWVSEDDVQSDDDGNYYCESCHGELFSYCEHYEETCPSEGMDEVIVRLHPRRTQWWSGNAIRDAAFTCANNGNRYHDDLGVEMANGDTWSQEAYEDEGGRCEATDECFPYSELVQLEDGTMWSKEHFATHGVTIEGKLYDKEDAPEQDEDEEDNEGETNAPTASPQVIGVVTGRWSHAEKEAERAAAVSGWDALQNTFGPWKIEGCGTPIVGQWRVVCTNALGVIRTWGYYGDYDVAVRALAAAEAANFKRSV